MREESYTASPGSMLQLKASFMHTVTSRPWMAPEGLLSRRTEQVCTSQGYLKGATINVGGAPNRRDAELVHTHLATLATVIGEGRDERE